MARAVRILALGDSLTEGYTQCGRKMHPYSTNLYNLLTRNNVAAEIDQRGISGEKVFPSMVQRLSRILHRTTDNPYDWVIILGGTNDLASTSDSEKLFLEGLKRMYDMVLDYANRKTKLVVMTVLERASVPLDHPADMARQFLNHLIRNYSTESQEKHRIYLVDLDKEIRFHGVENTTFLQTIWDDNIHLTASGYDYMGQLIFKTIQNDISNINT